MKPRASHPWVGAAPPERLPPRRELTEDELEGDKPRSRAYVRACGCSIHGPHVEGRCALAPAGERVELVSSCTCCGYRVAFGRCQRCGTAAAEVRE